MFLSGTLKFDRLEKGRTKVAGKVVEFEDGGEIITEDPQIWLGLLRRGWESVETSWDGANPQTLNEEILLAQQDIRARVQ